MKRKKGEMMAKRHLVIVFVVAVLILWTPLNGGAEDKRFAPKVVDTNPKHGANDVAPSLEKITVTFSKPMLDKSWSWSYEDKGSFPQIAGQPYYTDKGTICVLPVKLEPGKVYILWINTVKLKNFKDRNGNPVEPYRLTFTTRQK